MAEDMKNLETGGAPAQPEGTAAGAAEEKTEGGLVSQLKKLLGVGDTAKDGKEGKPSEEGTPPPGEKKPGTEGNAEGKKEGTPGKTYTQADLDAEVAKAVQAAKDEIAAAQAEEKRLAKLTPEQRAAEEQEAMKKQNEELAAKIKRMELEQKAAAGLAEKKLPSGLAAFLDYTDEEKMTESLEKLGAMYQADLEAGIKERLKGSTPKGLGSAANLTDGIVNAEIAKRIRGGF